MLIAFVGDVHGHVFDMLAAVITWQRRHASRLDFIVQVGDMGAYPDLQRTDEATAAHLNVDPSEADFARLMLAEDGLSTAIRRARNEFIGPIHFLRGNHEDFDWLASLPVDPHLSTAPVDGSDVLRYVPDATLLTVGATRLTFLGGVEERDDAASIDRKAHASLMALEPGSIDVLVTHQGPYGSSTGFRGDIHGSRLMTALVERLRPRFHIAGHAHQAIGPMQHGETTYLGLDGITPSRRWQPDAGGLQPGSLAILDTDTQSLTPISDDWLADFPTPLDFVGWCRRTLQAD